MAEPAAAPPEPTAAQAAQMMRSRRFVGLLIVVSIIGVVVSLAAWAFLELIYQIQRELYTHLPNALGYTHGPPDWWPVPILAVAALLVALAIARLPGDGGHLPARGLGAAGGTSPLDLPGIIFAALATIASGLVLGPEAPLIALGGGGALLTIRAARRQMPQPALILIAAAGSFAAISFIFGSPLIAAVILIEATAIGGPRLPMVLVPGLLAAGIGTLVSLGLGSFTGLNTAAFALGPIALPHFGHPTIGEFGWTILLAFVVAVVARGLMAGGLKTYSIVTRRLLLLLPVVGVLIAGLAIAFDAITDKGFNLVLFDGQAGLPVLVSQAKSWSMGALIWLIVFKGIAYALSLGSFRGGPTFPAVFLGAAGGIIASRLPGFPLTSAVAVGLGASVAAVLKLPLSAIVLATLMTVKAGTGDEPLIIVGVVVAYLVAVWLTTKEAQPAAAEDGSAAPGSQEAPPPAQSPTAQTGAITA